MKKTKIIFINLVFFSIFLTIFEIFSYFLIRSSNDGYYSIQDEERWSIEFHPGVGNIHSDLDFNNEINAKNSISESNLFTKKIIGNETKNLTILTLGGSTTDPLGSRFSGYEGTWPDLLAKNLSKSLNSSVTLINSGMAGATSSQELLRLITILNYMNERPEKIISFNGINEYYFFVVDDYLNPENILAAEMALNGLNKGQLPYKDKVFYSGNNFLNKIRTFLGKNSNIYFLLHKIKKYDAPINKEKKIFLSQENFKNIKRASKLWEENIKLMKLISDSKGFEYKVILQPTFGLDMDWKDLKVLNNPSRFLGKKKNYPVGFKIDRTYWLQMNNFYSVLRKSCKNMSYCIDMSNIKELNSEKKFYKDIRHLNREGNKYLVNKILSEI